MKVHLRQITDEGLHLEGEEDCPIADLAGEGIDCKGPLGYSLDLGISDGSLWANGRLSQPVEVTCVSCLERFDHTIEVPDFALLTELAGPETIDLTPFLREDTLLNLPANPRCDRSGDRVCPGPPITKDPGQSEVLAVPPPDWSALDKLKFGNK